MSRPEFATPDAPPLESTGSEIAVIGMAGQFPGAPDVETLWRNLRDGVESISRFRDDELESSALAPPSLREHPDFVPAGGVLAGADQFDHEFFGFSPREARWLDPQQRVFFQAAWAALEDAGYPTGKVSDRLAVYAGAGFSGHLLTLLGHADDPASQYEALSAGSSDNLASRVSYLLRLRGESVTVHTACSTGLSVVHLACQSLLAGSAPMALAGAVRIATPQRTGYVWQEGMILSKDGHCRAFDHRATGTVAGNGVGVVVLKPLADALADGDHIHAVIKGSALNNDGHSGASYTAPSVTGQTKVIAEALAYAGVNANDIDYVEAHGTGTPLGDPIEIAALTKAFRRTTDRVGDCAIGSIKTNIGHLDTAAGIAGLIKVVLMLRHGEMPPSLHLERPNAAIDFAASPFAVNSALRPWHRSGGRPRRAGVSSFGIGGANVHVVLEEAPALRRPAASRRECQLVAISAGSQAALSRMAGELADAVTEDAGELADIAYTRAVGRPEFPYRWARVAGAGTELADALREPIRERPAAAGPPQVGFLFPGQGSARRGMASELHRSEPDFREALQRCAASVEPELGRPLLPALCAGDGPIDDPELAHAALFTVEYALARLWQAWGVQPAALLGHSFGEYAAACVAGVLTLDDAARLAVIRGRLVSRLPEGRMLAVGLSDKELDDWLSDDLSLAAVNGDTRCVVSGPPEAVTALRERLAAAGHASVPLPVRHAFHSAAVEPVLEDLATVAAACPHGDPRLPLLSGLTGDWWPAEEGAVYWTQQMREPVRFAAALERVAGRTAAQPVVLVEVGPDQALTAMVRDQLRRRATAVPSLRSPRTKTTDQATLLAGVGALWQAGAPIDWGAFWRDEPRRRIPLPTYPFESVPVEAFASQPLSAAAMGPPAPAEPAPSHPTLAAPAGSGPPGDGPRDEIERKVLELWQERLGASDFGVHDDFLELGGNSLVAAQLLTRLRDVFAVPIPLSALFETPTVAEIAERIRSQAGETADVAEPAAGPALPPIRPTAREGAVPLSAVQERTLALETADPGNPALAMPVAVEIDGDLDVGVLERAIREVANRHETLRIMCHREAGAWTAKIASTPQVEIEQQDVADHDTAQRVAREEPTRPFDLSVSPLRARLLRLGAPNTGTPNTADQHILLLTVHHVVADTLSLVILVREIAACYRAFQEGEPSPLPPLAVQYPDFAAWQQKVLAGPALDGQCAYWRERLAGAPEQPLPLPTDRPRAGETGVRGSHLDVALPPELSQHVAEFSQRLGVTPFVTLLAAYAALLGRVTGADDLVIGAPVGNRDRPELEPLLGYVAHSLPLRTDLSGDPRFEALARQVKQTLLDAYAHPDVPYEHLAAKPGAARLFDAVLVLHADLPQEQRLPGATWRLWRVSDAPAMFGATLAAVTLMLAESPDGYTGTMGYADELFEPATAGRLFDQLQTLLAGALRRPETRLSALPLGGEAPTPAPLDTPGQRPYHLGDTGLPPWLPRQRRRDRSLQLSLSYFANDEDAAAADEDGKYRLLLAGARLADRSGLAAVWTPERHFHSFGGLYPSPAAVNAALAASTTRVAIRAGSVVLPLHDPIRVAEDWAVIDNLSGGRVGVSFASGWHPDDFVLAPDQFSRRRELLREGIDTVRALWRGEPVRRRNGVGQETEVRIRPRPVQPELPFWLTAAGSPHTFALAGELGAGVLTNLMAQSLDDLVDKIQAYRDAWRSAGHDGDGHVTLMLHTFLADDAERAYETARGPLLRYFRSSVDVARGFAAAQGLAVRPEDLSDADVQELLERGLERYLHHGGLFGAPDTCAEVLERVRGIGVDEVAALVDYGTSLPDTLHSIRLLGTLAGQESKRADAAAAAAVAGAGARSRQLADAVVARGADAVVGSADALAWLAETAPDALAGRTAAVTDPDVPEPPLREVATAADRVLVPAPELPDGSLPARWAQWHDGREPVVTPGAEATLLDTAGRPLGTGVVGELALSGTRTGQRARWRPDGQLHLLQGPVPGAAPAPLSFAQQRIWSLEQLAPGNLAYHNAMALRLRGRLDVAALRRALQEVVDRHEALRTTFHGTDDGPVQVVHPELDVDLPTHDAGPDDVPGLARAHSRELFALDQLPLLRATLLRLADTEHVALISMHHIVSDGWSAGVLVGELGALYEAFARGESSPLPPLAMQYGDYVTALRQRHDAGDNDRDVEYWRHALAGVPPLELPTDLPRPPVQGQEGARAPAHVDRDGANAVTELARASGATTFMVLCAGLAALLHRHSGQTDLVIGTPVAGRSLPGAETLVGVFINTVAIRVDLTGDPVFTDLLARVKSATLDAIAHQEAPFEVVVDALAIPRDPSRAPLCQALLVLHNTPAPRAELGGLSLEMLDVDTGTAKLDLTVEFREGPEGLGGAFEYHADLFEEATVAGLADQLGALLAAATAEPDCRLSELELPGVPAGGGQRAS